MTGCPDYWGQFRRVRSCRKIGTSGCKSGGSSEIYSDSGVSGICPAKTSVTVTSITGTGAVTTALRDVSEAGVTWQEQELVMEWGIGHTGVIWLADPLQQAICIGSATLDICVGHDMAEID